MSMAASVVLFADQGEPDWVADTKYFSSPVDPFLEADGVVADADGNVVVAVSGSPGFGFHCYNKYAGLTQLRLNNGIVVAGGGTGSPDGRFVTFPDGSVKVFYTPTFDDPGGINTTQAFNIFDVNLATGALTTFAVGRDANINFNDGGFTQMTSAGGDSSGNFYGCGFTRRSGNNEYPYLVKYNSAGAVQFATVLQPQIQKFTGGGVDTANFGTQAVVVVDSSGNTYVRLRHTTNSQIPTFTIKLMKFNSSGVQQWVRIVENFGDLSATDGTYIYSAATPTSSTIRVVATETSDGTIAWETTLSTTGFNLGLRGIEIAGGSVYVKVAAADTDSISLDNQTGLTWVKLSTSGALENNRHIYASGSISGTNFFNEMYGGAISGAKTYSLFRGLGGITTVKLPLDGSKTGNLGTLPYLTFGGSAPFSYTARAADINVVELAITAATTSVATSTSSAYGTTTTTLTTADVFTLGLGVTFDKSQINSILAPSNDQNPLVTYSKRQLR